MTGDVQVVIPARGGSKGVAGKNLARVGGLPLVVRAVQAARRASRVTAVAVTTDDPAIATAASAAGALTVHRPAELAGDIASSESALRHAVEVLYDRHSSDLAVVVLVRCTSPFITAAELDAVVAAVLDDGADTAFTAAPFHGFLWRGGAEASGVNHSPLARQRRQDREPELLETGTAYAMRADGFAAHGHRFFGRIVAVPTDPARVLEIDEPADLDRARALAPLLDAGGRPGPGEVDAVVLDVDGTRTDDRALLAADETEPVAVHRGDGMGVAAMRRAGLPVLILSTEVNSVVAVASAQARVRAAARTVTSVPGGHGAVREIASWIRRKDQP